VLTRGGSLSLHTGSMGRGQREERGGLDSGMTDLHDRLLFLENRLKMLDSSPPPDQTQSRLDCP
jgi:hypothetical protein